MISEETLKTIIRQVMDEMQCNQKTDSDSAEVSIADYPLGEKRPELLQTPKGRPFKEVTFDGMLKGSVAPEEFRISPLTLELQAKIALEAKRPCFANNLQRAAEMTQIPDQRLLEIYEALRPRRSTEDELLKMAEELENVYHAKKCAEWVREAADVYKQRGLLRNGELV
ncbi:propanediol dehydratase small subunit [Acetomicrobium thermoterrenum DSM 13490]|uniref:Propanediol dehydratase small subunit n=1 Tax=Acetomicrobium thermoterrenum DSM 13490 TaxID=1120987 RepID=A0A1H3GAQ7_9BACT|nr:diol dehydratase small subunit [Acetomicrobium thermoterrenum]SDY00351.1 propanediol dehydratase small subunit [Acetomicrobium thermoterrenum DSM 13490]